MQTKINDDIIMIQGTATKDAEYKIVGEKCTPLCSFSLAVGKNQDTTTIFANCKAWRNIANYANGIKKGDSVVAIGKVHEREYNGKVIKDFNCDWINYIGSSTVNTPVFEPINETDGIPSGFNAVADVDDDLLF